MKKPPDYHETRRCENCCYFVNSLNGNYMECLKYETNLTELSGYNKHGINQIHEEKHYICRSWKKEFSKRDYAKYSYADKYGV